MDWWYWVVSVVAIGFAIVLVAQLRWLLLFVGAIFFIRSFPVFTAVGLFIIVMALNFREPKDGESQFDVLAEAFIQSIWVTSVVLFLAGISGGVLEQAGGGRVPVTGCASVVTWHSVQLYT